MATSPISINPKANTTTGPSQIGLVRVSKESQDRLVRYLQSCQMMGFQNWNIREVMRNVDLQYAREEDYTRENQKAKQANRAGNANKIQNITVPVVLPSVEAAVTYQSSVFLTGTPLFGVVSSPDYMDAAKQMEAIIDAQAIKGGWNRHLVMSFRDTFKYNFAAVECAWEKTMIPAFGTSVASTNPNSLELKKVAWEGNVLRRWDPYNTFWDLRYAITEVSSRGEFVGKNELISRTEFKTYLARDPFVIRQNIRSALEAPQVTITVGSDFSQLSYYVPQISYFQTLNPLLATEFDWFSWSGLDSSRRGSEIAYKNIYQKTILYARIIPSDFGLDAPAPNTPQAWKLTYINNTVLIAAEPLSLAYDSLPVLFMQANEDGLSYQTKSLASNSAPFQSVTSALMNSVLASRRRSATDRVLYDPSRVAADQINSDNPSAKIPVRPAAYGKPLSDAVYAFPFRDDQSGLVISEIGQLIELENKLSGQNRAKQGQFVKGNKTRSEYESVMANANGPDQVKALLFESQFFTPLKEIIKTNILQYQTPATVYSRELKTSLNVDPVKLRQAALEFKVSDGIVPTDKLISGDALSGALNALGTTPQLAAGYNLAPMFSYLMKTQGADLSEFEKSPAQQAYEQAVNQWTGLCQQIAEMTIKAGQTIDPKSFPAQPVPEQYGYTPGAPTPSQAAKTGGSSILDQWTGISQAKSAASQTQAADPMDQGAQ